MPVGIVGILLRLALAVLVFFLVTYWPVPQILVHFGLAVPMIILWIIGFILAVLTFFRSTVWATGNI
jgi:uncharacterized membrane protein